MNITIVVNNNGMMVKPGRRVPDAAAGTWPMMPLSHAMITIKTSRIGSRILMTCAIIMPKRLMPGI